MVNSLPNTTILELLTDIEVEISLLANRSEAQGFNDGFNQGYESGFQAGYNQCLEDSGNLSK